MPVQYQYQYSPRVRVSVSQCYLPLTAVCQKVIVPVVYTYCGKQYFRLKKADVREVLKYKSLD